MELHFEGCRVRPSSRLGKAGQGYAISRRAIVCAAPLAAALSCGLLAEALDYALSRVRSRDPGSGPLSEFQPVEIVLAEVMASLDTSQALAWAAAGAVDESAPAAERLARESKWICSEAAVQGIDSVTGLLGPEASVKVSLCADPGKGSPASPWFALPSMSLRPSAWTRAIL